MTDFWAENFWEPGKHELVDLGYVKCKDTRDRADRLLAAGLGRRNLQVAAYGRLLIRIPPSKVRTILRQFRGIRRPAPARMYCDCTHTWATRRSCDQKYAMGIG